jgi:ATP-dependent protease HslVU (ClpYQ) peptidase subunit
MATLTATPKVGRFGNLLIGYAGSFKVGQQFFRAASRLQSPTMEALLGHVTTDEKDWALLIIENKRIFEVDETFAVIEAYKENGYSYGAIGSGAHPALGALNVSAEDESALMRALEASEAHTTSVRKPFTIVSL